MMDLLEALRKESAILRGAPFSVGLLMLMAGGVGVYAANAWSARSITVAEQSLKAMENERDFYKTCVESGVITTKCRTTASAPPKDEASAPPAASPPSQAPSEEPVPEKPTPSRPVRKAAHEPEPSAGEDPFPATPVRAPAPAAAPAASQAPPAIWGVIHLNQTKLRLALKEATKETVCKYQTTCYSYRVYIERNYYPATDNLTVNLAGPGTYNFRIVATTETTSTIPVFENTCAGRFEVQDRASWMEFRVRFEPFDRTANVYRFKDCALVPQ